VHSDSALVEGRLVGAFDFRLKGSGSSLPALCPEKMHYIQGADDLLGEMRWPVGQEGSARLHGADDAALDGGARFKVEVNGGVPVHIDESFDKRTQHERISNSNEFRLKSSSFITVVVADQGHMERIDGGAVSANLLGECMYHDPTGSQNKRGVGDGPQDVKPKVVFLARNLSAITASNAKLCSERSIRGEEGHDYHGRLNAGGTYPGSQNDLPWLSIIILPSAISNSRSYFINNSQSFYL
jgi:hypothetical protein